MTRKPPLLPGVILRQKIIDGMNVNQKDLAQAAGISAVRINQIINGNARISAQIALRLAKATATNPKFWLRLQADYDVFWARIEIAEELRNLPSLTSTRSTVSWRRRGADGKFIKKLKDGKTEG